MAAHMWYAVVRAMVVVPKRCVDCFDIGLGWFKVVDVRESIHLNKTQACISVRTTALVPVPSSKV